MQTARTETANPRFSAVVAILPREHSRTEAREAIRTVLDADTTIGMVEYRFMASHLMAKLGYGGGF